MAAKWIKQAENIYKRGSKYYLVRQVNKKRVFILLALEGQPVTDLPSALIAASTITVNSILKGNSIAEDLKRFYAFKIKHEEWRETTLRSQKNGMEIIARELGGHERSLASVTVEQLQKWYDDLSARAKSPATRDTYWGLACSLFRWAHEDAKVIPFNPCKQVRIKKFQHRSRKKRLNFEQANAALDAAAKQERFDVGCFMFLALTAGFRPKEIDNARPEWLDLENRNIRITNLSEQQAKLLNIDTYQTKTGREGEIPMDERFHEFLSRHKIKGPYLIHPEKHHRGKGRYRYDMRRPINDFLKANNLAFNPYALRHSFASLLASSGRIQIHEIAQWMRNSVRVTERTYTHMIPNSSRLSSALKGPPNPAEARSEVVAPPPATP